MTLPSDLPLDLPPELAHSGVRAADRLGFTLFLAALLHLALILGLGFSFAEPKQITKTLEITLATFKSETKPKKADFLAQDNQQGSGTLDKKAIPKTTEVAPFQDNQVNKVTPPPAAKPEVKEAAPKAAVATSALTLTSPPHQPVRLNDIIVTTLRQRSIPLARLTNRTLRDARRAHPPMPVVRASRRPPRHDDDRLLQLRSNHLNSRVHLVKHGHEDWHLPVQEVIAALAPLRARDGVHPCP